jgi:Predicted amidophosphoribosyltransferases
MYSKNKRNEYCLICFKHLLEKYGFYNLIFRHHCICISCLSKFKDFLIKEKIDGVEYFYLYQYNTFFKDLLFQYKGLYDIALKDIFLYKYHNYLKRKYKDYIIVVAPSSALDNRKRGFAPMFEIASTLNLPIYSGLHKLNNYKQANVLFKERSAIKDNLGINAGKNIFNKKVVLIDDVITSGYTIKACINLLKQQNPKKIKVLIIAKNQKGKR